VCLILLFRAGRGQCQTTTENGNVRIQNAISPQLFMAPRVRYNVGLMALDSDLELMLRVRRGDAESFDELLRRYRAPLISFFARMVRDRGLAEDLAQEVFLRVYRSRERYRPDARFTTWLYRIATNLALNALRDRRALRAEVSTAEGESEPEAARVADHRPTIEETLIESERVGRILRAIEALPENQCAAVILHKYQGIDHRQIARVLGVSESAVKSLLFRAYENLRARLEPLLKGGNYGVPGP
jgi:RNA polymerase sigma-70 factor, ECF subfamily